MDITEVTDHLRDIADNLIYVAELLGPTVALVDRDPDRRERLLAHLAAELEFEATLWIPSGAIDEIGGDLTLCGLAVQRLVRPGPLRAPFDPLGEDGPERGA